MPDEELGDANETIPVGPCGDSHAANVIGDRDDGAIGDALANCGNPGRFVSNQNGRSLSPRGALKLCLARYPDVLG